MKQVQGLFKSESGLTKSSGKLTVNTVNGGGSEGSEINFSLRGDIEVPQLRSPTCC